MSSSPVVEPTSTKLTRHTPARSTKDKYETMEKLQAWMTDKVYGIGGTKDCKCAGLRRHNSE